MLALISDMGVNFVVRMHHLGGYDFSRRRKLGDKDHVVEWKNPRRLDWIVYNHDEELEDEMDEEELDEDELEDEELKEEELEELELELELDEAHGCTSADVCAILSELPFN